MSIPTEQLMLGPFVVSDSVYLYSSDSQLPVSKLLEECQQPVRLVVNLKLPDIDPGPGATNCDPDPPLNYIEVTCKLGAVLSYVNLIAILHELQQLVNNRKRSDVAVLILCQTDALNNQAAFVVVNALVHFRAFSDIRAAVKAYEEISPIEIDAAHRAALESAYAHTYLRMPSANVPVALEEMDDGSSARLSRVILRLLNGKEWPRPSPQSMALQDNAEAQYIGQRYWITHKVANAIRYAVLVDAYGIYAMDRYQRVWRVCGSVNDGSYPILLPGCAAVRSDAFYLFDCELVGHHLYAFDLIHEADMNMPMSRVEFCYRYSMLDVCLSDMQNIVPFWPIRRRDFFLLSSWDAHGPGPRPPYETNGIIICDSRSTSPDHADVVKLDRYDCVDFQISLDICISLAGSQPYDKFPLQIDDLIKSQVQNMHIAAGSDAVVILQCKRSQDDDGDDTWVADCIRQDRCIPDTLESFNALELRRAQLALLRSSQRFSAFLG